MSDIDWAVVAGGGYDEFRRARQRYLDLLRFDSELAGLARTSEIESPGKPAEEGDAEGRLQQRA